jgi:hypothetical protein
MQYVLARRRRYILQSFMELVNGFNQNVVGILQRHTVGKKKKP